ncbi:MAG: starch-binding protein, partial [Gammaproteobacteria bacterium]|nr:starch-binding protein [Gammaproteobacteria bacterium]
TILNGNSDKYIVLMDDSEYSMEEVGGVYVATLKLNSTKTVVVKDSNNVGYEVDTKSATVEGDYEVIINPTSNTTSINKVTNYYIYINNSTAPKMLKASGENFEIVVELEAGDRFLIKDDLHNIINDFTEDSANKGQAFAKGTYTITLNKNDKAIKVVSGGTISDDSLKDGKWPVTLDLNYQGAEDASIVYVEHNKVMNTPATPLRDGYTFDGWYEDSYCLVKAEFGAKISYFKVTAPTTIFAKWSKVSGGGDTPGPGPDQPGPGPDQPGPGPDQPGTTCDYHVDADGDGLCDKCGEAMPVSHDTYDYLYLDVTRFPWFKNDGAVINCHIRYTDGSNNGWPGDVMTLEESGEYTGLYKVRYYSSRTIKGITFTRNSPDVNPNEGVKTEWDRIDLGEITFNQAKPIYKVKTYNHVDDKIKFTGKWISLGETDEDDVVEGRAKLYLDFREVSWFMDSSPTLMCYIWYTDGTDNGGYPGKIMKFTSSATTIQYSAYVNYDETKTIAGVIFTRNNSVGDLTGEGDDMWNKIEIKGEDLVFSNDKPAYRLKSLNGFAYEGLWETEAAALDTTLVGPDQPDENEEVDSTENKDLFLNITNIPWFSADNAVVSCKIKYTDKTVNSLTGKVSTLDGSLYKWSYNKDKTIEAIAVYRKSPLGETWNILNIHAPQEGKDVYTVYSVSDSTHTGLWQTNATQGDTEVTLYYYNEKDWSGNLYAYAYNSDSGLSNAQWPGVKMTQVEGHDKWYSIKVNTKFTFIIFNINEEQTPNIAIDLENNYYYHNKWINTFKEPSIEDNVTIYYFNEFSWPKVCVHYWGGTSSTGWPGKEMTAVEGHINWYSLSIPKDSTGLLFTNGSQSDNRKTKDLTLDNTNYYYYGGEWINEFREPEAWDGTLTVDITYEYFGSSDSAYLYVWYKDGTDNTWPGEKMTKVNGTIKTFTGLVSTNKVIAGVIVIRGDGNDKYWNKTDDITEISIITHKVVVTNMIQY